MHADTEFAYAQQRIDAHRREAAEARLTRRPSTRVAGLRRQVGGWFIALGRAIAVPAAPRRETGTR